MPFAPAGRLCLVTWQPLAANDWLTIPGAALLEYGNLPHTVDGPGMFTQSDPVTVTNVLRDSGFSEINVTAQAVPCTSVRIQRTPPTTSPTPGWDELSSPLSLLTDDRRP